MGALRLTYTKNYRPLKVMRGNFYLQKNSDAERYAFGFNGQLKDNEIYGEGNAYTAEFWEYDPRSIRRWNVDPATRKYPFKSPYVAYHNNPIFWTDPLGDDPPDIKSSLEYGQKKSKTFRKLLSQNSITTENYNKVISFGTMTRTYNQNGNITIQKSEDIQE